MAETAKDLLQGEPLSLNEREKELVRKSGVTLNYPKGHIIFAAEEIADRVYLIEKGWVKIYRLSADGREVTVGSIRNPGEMMGLAETLYHGKRTCFAGAISDVTLVVVTKKDFLELLTDEHYFSLKVAKLLAARMREAEAMVHELVCWQVPGRLALLLLKIGERCGIEEEDGIKIKLRLTHEEIAGMIGTTRQTVTSLLNTFKKEKSINLEGREIKILDPKKLASWIV
ncbi:CRP-like cAMP-binding protein [Thermodesulfitimonas autotrophica]|uniref:CRP-like cAMP-binding protein n=1 Tax=Thermodesulfitimonas autotrophica TaxID=1894989 RepID=A0A3N5AP92_9THEO|nr:Crp/Fnr family transcriptional regulator [Thermodesulfitimonas autotrophica]RPF46929.1 CRP-like cAMP-binding protein [Thermodesulfitimonas autotrophica]